MTRKLLGGACLAILMTSAAMADDITAAQYLHKQQEQVVWSDTAACLDEAIRAGILNGLTRKTAIADFAVAMCNLESVNFYRGTMSKTEVLKRLIPVANDMVAQIVN